MSERVKVLYIAGTGRSGSTLLNNILGQVDGFFAGSELYWLWNRGLLENRLCGCGRPFDGCPVWASILRAAFGGAERIDAEQLIALRDSVTRTYHLPRLLLRGLPANAQQYLDSLQELYHAIHRCTGSRVIVDASKFPAYGRLLAEIADIDLYILHLVRDPRAVAHSWQRRKQWLNEADTPTMRRYSVPRSAGRWIAQNVATEAFWRRVSTRYLLLHYETFVEQPRQATEQILRFVGGGGTLPFIDEHTIELSPTHGIWGNPMRSEVGRVVVQADEAWQSEMPSHSQALVTWMTWPLLLRYRYALRWPRAIL